MRRLLLLLVAASSITIHSQVVLSQETIQFPQVLTGSTVIQSVYARNTGLTAKSYKLNYNSSEVFQTFDTLLTISPNDSAAINFNYSPKHNIIDKYIVAYVSEDSTDGFVISLTGSGKYEGDYYNSTFNLFDAELKAALFELTKGHYQLGYNLARDRMFDTIDKQPGDTIECVYSGRKIKAANRTQAQSQDFNTEHTWPQSLFNSSEPMLSDLNHLFPTDATANSIRSNYQFGIVVSGITWSVGGSKLGRNSSNQIVFEVRDKNKGNTARAVLYFVLRYPQNFGTFVNSYQEGVLRNWHKIDPVDTIEIKRNNYIFNYQQKRNPLIDHPEFVDRIYSFYLNPIRPTSPGFDVYPFKLSFDSTGIGNNSKKMLNVFNDGTATLKIDSIRIDNSSFSIASSIDSVQKKENKKIEVSFTPGSLGKTTGVLNVYTNAGLKSLSIEGTGIEVSNVNETPFTKQMIFELEQNYPNPFNPITKIRFTIPENVNGVVTLKVFDVLGNLVAELLNEEKSAGNHEIEFNSKGLSSGIYFYRLSASMGKTGELIETKKMLLLR